jgi:uncharacterized membrane protein/uncharacterized protein (UPF0548 family)
VGRVAVAWRLGRGWSDAELRERLAAVDPRAVNFDPAAPLTAERGWNEVRSHAVVAREPPGPPLADGAYARARRLVAACAHSDPRIVVAHFDAAAPLAGRVLLLELISLRLHFLCPAVVGETRDDAGGDRATAGFSLVTLRGHVERGREWFLVEKDHATGDVRLRIEASWRAGDFPGWWAWAGFQLLGRRSQRRWHRLAHLRLRRLLVARAEGPRRGGLAHEGAHGPTDRLEVSFSRGAARAAQVTVEREEERMRWDRWLAVAGLGAVAGGRSMTPLALLAAATARQRATGGDRLARAFASPWVAGALGVLALGEIAADKWPAIPPRTEPAPLAFRALAGAAAADVLAARAEAPAWRAALLGASAAVLGTFAFAALRRALERRVPEPGAGFVEDALVLGAGAALLARLRPGASAGGAAVTPGAWAPASPS